MLNREQKGESTLTTMLGGIPSYTDLGMALLLPHQTLNITENGVFLVDGISTQGTESRTKVLRATKPESLAITYESISGMNKQQMQKTFAGIKLIYIYHNAIDAEGDKASTEHKVFHATEEAFKELSGLVRKIVNDIGIVNFFITADRSEGAWIPCWRKARLIRRISGGTRRRRSMWRRL